MLVLLQVFSYVKARLQRSKLLYCDKMKDLSIARFQILGVTSIFVILLSCLTAKYLVDSDFTYYFKPFLLHLGVVFRFGSLILLYLFDIVARPNSRITAIFGISSLQFSKT